MNNLLSRDEIIDLINEILRLDEIENLEKSEKKRTKLCFRLRDGVLDPSVINYIYYENPSLTPEQIADRALAYKPIILPDESQR